MFSSPARDWHWLRRIPWNRAPGPMGRTEVSGSDSRSGGGLVEGRARHFVQVYLRRTFDHLLQRLDHAGIRAAGIRLRVFFQIPHADADRVCSARGDESDFVLEALLLPKDRKDVVVEDPGELCRAPWLEMEGNTACIHVNLLGWLAKERETR